MRVTQWLARGSCLVAAAWVLSGCGAAGDAREADTGLSDGGAWDAQDDGGFRLDAGSGCVTSADCDGGVCVGSVCCPSAESACGGGCCAGGSVCLFDRCVTPGAPCTTSNDCKPGQYCEPALGGPAGDAGPKDSGCVEPAPRPGRCLDKPPVCPEGDAGAPDSGCVDKCEYHPTAGRLDAIPEWSWGPVAKEFPGFTDVWSTPTVGRVFDANCDGKVDQLDPPNVIFVSGDAEGVCCSCNGAPTSTCHTGVLRLLNGRDGSEVWSLRRASTTSVGFMGLSVSLGDLDGDGRIDIAAVTGEGYVVIVDGTGKVKATSDKPIPGAAAPSFGWGGGLAIADIDHDGHPEIAYGETVFTTAGGGLTLRFGAAASNGGQDLSTFVDLDLAPDGNLELLAGNVAYRADGTVLWKRTDIGLGHPAVGDFDKDGKPDVALVHGGQLWILAGADGKTELGPVDLPGTGSGGPPTVADFDGDKRPEIGVAMADFYSVLKPDYAKGKIDVLWKTQNHDLSSSVTGSSVFDFEGDGRAEVVYNDECYLWVFDGPTGKVRFAALTTSFTATEASVVADVDGDGHAEILMVSNGADPTKWKCNVAPWTSDDPVTGRPAWKPPSYGKAYRGLTAWGSANSSWVGTRTLWSEHTYHVSNICDDRDGACEAPNLYGSIPRKEKANWTVPWLNDFRQNVQDKGIFDAPDATVSLRMQCTTPVTGEVSLRNMGMASLPKGVEIAVYDSSRAKKTVARVTSTTALYPGQTEKLTFAVPEADGVKEDVFVARVLFDPKKSTFVECRTDNDESAPAKASCTK